MAQRSRPELAAELSAQLGGASRCRPLLPQLARFTLYTTQRVSRLPLDQGIVSLASSSSEVEAVRPHFAAPSRGGQLFSPGAPNAASGSSLGGRTWRREVPLGLGDLSSTLRGLLRPCADYRLPALSHRCAPHFLAFDSTRISSISLNFHFNPRTGNSLLPSTPQTSTLPPVRHHDSIHL